MSDKSAAVLDRPFHEAPEDDEGWVEFDDFESDGLAVLIEGAKPLWSPPSDLVFLEADKSPRLGFDLSHERADDGWVVEDRSTGIFGYGVELSASLEDFRSAAREHRDVLERQTALSGSLAEQLEYLRARL